MGTLKKTEWTEKKIQDKLRMYFMSPNTKKYEITNLFIYGWESDYLAVTKSMLAYEVEIKVSKADFNNDFKNKQDKHLLFEDGSMIGRFPKGSSMPNYFYYAVPDGLINVDEVPDYAGLLYVQPWGITFVKQPKKLTDEKFDPVKLVLIIMLLVMLLLFGIAIIYIMWSEDYMYLEDLPVIGKYFDEEYWENEDEDEDEDDEDDWDDDEEDEGYEELVTVLEDQVEELKEEVSDLKERNQELQDKLVELAEDGSYDDDDWAEDIDEADPIDEEDDDDDWDDDDEDDDDDWDDDDDDWDDDDDDWDDDDDD